MFINFVRQLLEKRQQKVQQKFDFVVKMKHIQMVFK